MDNRYKLRNRHCIKVGVTDIPSNINWTSLEKTPGQRRMRKIIFILIILSAMILSTISVIAASYVQKDLNKRQ